jgi:hypothetical protein
LYCLFLLNVLVELYILLQQYEQRRRNIAEVLDLDSIVRTSSEEASQRSNVLIGWLLLYYLYVTISRPTSVLTADIAYDFEGRSAEI